MASTVTTTFPINGSRNFTAVIQIVGDTTSNFSGQAVIDPKAAISNVQASAGLTGLPAKFKIKSIDWEFTGFTGALYWDADTDVLAAALPQYDGRIDFFTGSGAPLINNAGTGVTGKLLLTTAGLTASMWGTIVIQGYH